MSDQPSPTPSEEVTEPPEFIDVINQGLGLALLAVVTLIASLALGDLDALHDPGMGTLYLTVAWSCWWIIVLASWTFFGLALWRTWRGMVALKLTDHARICLVTGGFAFVSATFFLIDTARTFAGAIWL